MGLLALVAVLLASVCVGRHRQILRHVIVVVLVDVRHVQTGRAGTLLLGRLLVVLVVVVVRVHLVAAVLHGVLQVVVAATAAPTPATPTVLEHLVLDQVRQVAAAQQAVFAHQLVAQHVRLLLDMHTLHACSKIVTEKIPKLLSQCYIFC